MLGHYLTAHGKVSPNTPKQVYYHQHRPSTDLLVSQWSSEHQPAQSYILNQHRTYYTRLLKNRIKYLEYHLEEQGKQFQSLNELYMMAEQNERRALKELEELRRKVKEVGLELTINKKWVEELFKDNEELKAREKERVEIYLGMRYELERMQEEFLRGQGIKLELELVKKIEKELVKVYGYLQEKNIECVELRETIECLKVNHQTKEDYRCYHYEQQCGKINNLKEVIEQMETRAVQLQQNNDYLSKLAEGSHQKEAILYQQLNDAMLYMQTVHTELAKARYRVVDVEAIFKEIGCYSGEYARRKMEVYRNELEKREMGIRVKRYEREKEVNGLLKEMSKEMEEKKRELYRLRMELEESEGRSKYLKRKLEESDKMFRYYSKVHSKEKYRYLYDKYAVCEKKLKQSKEYCEQIKRNYAKLYVSVKVLIYYTEYLKSMIKILKKEISELTAQQQRYFYNKYLYLGQYRALQHKNAQLEEYIKRIYGYMTNKYEEINKLKVIYNNETLKWTALYKYFTVFKYQIEQYKQSQTPQQNQYYSTKSLCELEKCYQQYLRALHEQIILKYKPTLDSKPVANHDIINEYENKIQTILTDYYVMQSELQLLKQNLKLPYNDYLNRLTLGLYYSTIEQYLLRYASNKWQTECQNLQYIYNTKLASKEYLIAILKMELQHQYICTLKHANVYSR